MITDNQASDLYDKAYKTLPSDFGYSTRDFFILGVQQAQNLIAAECAEICERVAEDVTYQRDSQGAADKCYFAIRERFGIEGK